MALENNVGKGENDGNPAPLPIFFQQQNSSFDKNLMCILQIL